MKSRFYPLLAAIACALIPLHAHACAPQNAPCAIYRFRDYGTGGAPEGGLVLGPNGTLYGETSAGGTKPCNATYGEAGEGCGTVYSLSAKDGYKVLVSFHGPNGAFGASTVTLVGNTLYGTTQRGGAGQNGVIFAVNTDGSNFTLLHQFKGPDGSDPLGPLVPGPNGILYGITNIGGPGLLKQSAGVLFSLTPTGTYKILYEFSEADGENPNTLVMTPSGILAGGTTFGGPTNPDYCPQGCGVIFSFNPANSQYTILKTYSGGYTYTSSPFIGSVGPDGTIYGNDEDLFSITLSGNYQILAVSNVYYTGDYPQSGPLLAPDGTLYGTYTSGAGVISGSLYSYNPSNPGVLNFVCPGGSAPQPILAPNGDLINTSTLPLFGTRPAGGEIYDCTP